MRNQLELEGGTKAFYSSKEWAESILSGDSDQTDLFRELERSQSSWENVMEEAASSFLFKYFSRAFPTSDTMYV